MIHKKNKIKKKILLTNLQMIQFKKQIQKYQEQQKNKKIIQIKFMKKTSMINKTLKMLLLIYI